MSIGYMGVRSRRQEIFKYDENRVADENWVNARYPFRNRNVDTVSFVCDSSFDVCVINFDGRTKETWDERRLLVFGWNRLSGCSRDRRGREYPGT